MSEKAEGIMLKAVELWPILQRPFAQDPVDDAIETEGFRGKIYTYLIEKSFHLSYSFRILLLHSCIYYIIKCHSLDILQICVSQIIED